MATNFLATDDIQFFFVTNRRYTINSDGIFIIISQHAYMLIFVVIGQNRIRTDISKILCTRDSHYDDDVNLPKTSPRELFLFIYP